MKAYWVIAVAITLATTAAGCGSERRSGGTTDTAANFNEARFDAAVWQ